MNRLIAFVILSFGWIQTASAADAQLDLGRQGILNRTGCYLVDYSFVETESLKAGYIRDNRVYDVNKNQSVKEWIYAEEISPERIRLQHVLFVADLSGKVIPTSLLKHTGEDWSYNSLFLYDFTSINYWNVKTLTPNLWTRRITNLDDGLRYQCASSWVGNAYPEWTCDNYSPIPGRETRDMGRSDYNGLQRSSRVISYGANWLEREENIKTIENNGTKTALAKEVGKTWYSRLPDAECSEARDFVKPRLAFWNLVRETWDQVLIGDRPFQEKTVNGRTRYSGMMTLEHQYIGQDLGAPGVRSNAQTSILKLIQDYRQ